MIRYAHTNLIARDWQRLADFYVGVFQCEPVSSPRDHHGPAIEALTGLAGVRFRGRHLRLPGHGEHGPTLEIFQYEQPAEEVQKVLHRPGLAHLAFEVDDVAAKRAEVLAAGGSDYGETVILNIPGAGRLQLVYMTDPEGNIVELQKWG